MREKRVSDAPNEVIWKQLLYFWICVRKCLESVSVPENNERNGSDGGINGANLTLSLAQHNPGVSFLYFNVLQCGHTTLIDPMATNWSAL